MAPEQERRITIKTGEKVRLVFEEGPFFDIRNRPYPTTPISVEQKSFDPREETRERLKARYPNILLPHVKARLTQHGYRVVGGEGAEELSNEMALMESESNLRKWMENARMSGISNKDIQEETSAILKQISIGSPRIGEKSPLINGINTEIQDMVRQAFDRKRKLEKGKG